MSMLYLRTPATLPRPLALSSIMVKRPTLLRWGSGKGDTQQTSSDPSASSRFFDSSKSATLQHSSITSQAATNGGLLLNLSVTHQSIPDAPPSEPPSEIPASSQPSCSVPEVQVHESSPRRRAQVYYDSLLPEGRGSPLYTPGPDMDLSKEYRKEGVRLGDVVIINSSGGVSYLFNIFAPADDPINYGRVPDSFKPIPKHVAQMERHPYCPNVVMSSSVRSSSSLGFETLREGALVAMPSGATSASLVNTTFFNKYVDVHCETWYHFVLAKGRPVDNGDIRLVVGSDKTTTWGTATFLSHETAGGQVVFRPLPEDKDSITQYTYQCFGSASAQTGPKATEMDDLREPGSSMQPIENQCVFLRTLNPRLADHVYDEVVQRVKAEGFGEWDEYLRLDARDNPPSIKAEKHEQANGAVQFLSKSLVKVSINHPSDELNRNILGKFPNARLVITEDRHWTSLITKSEPFPCYEELIDRMEKTYDFLEEGGVVTIRDLDVSRGSSLPQGVTLGTQKTMNDSKFLEERNEKRPPSEMYSLTAQSNESIGGGLYHYKPPSELHGPLVLHPLLSVGTKKLYCDLTTPPIPHIITKHSDSIDATLWDQPATNPPSSVMEVECSLLPWKIRIVPPQHSRYTHITCSDILSAIYQALRKQVTEAEYRQVSSHSLRLQIDDAYKRRYKRLSDHSHYEKERLSGLRRVDFLGEYIMFDGLSCNTNDHAQWTLHLLQPNAAQFL